MKKSEERSWRSENPAMKRIFQNPKLPKANNFCDSSDQRQRQNDTALLSLRSASESTVLSFEQSTDSAEGGTKTYAVCYSSEEEVLPPGPPHGVTFEGIMDSNEIYTACISTKDVVSGTGTGTGRETETVRIPIPENSIAPMWASYINVLQLSPQSDAQVRTVSLMEVIGQKYIGCIGTYAESPTTTSFSETRTSSTMMAYEHGGMTPQHVQDCVLATSSLPSVEVTADAAMIYM